MLMRATTGKTCVPPPLGEPLIVIHYQGTERDKQAVPLMDRALPALP